MGLVPKLLPMVAALWIAAPAHAIGHASTTPCHSLWVIRGTCAVPPKQFVRPFGRWAVDPCTAAIIDKEDPSWNPRKWNTAGSGAYGLGQALPASKMRPYGNDYMWNPWTQVRWMVAYETSRYGSPCRALAFWNSHYWY